MYYTNRIRENYKNIISNFKKNLIFENIKIKHRLNIT